MKLIDTRQAVGHVLCHDLTQIIPGEYKGARFHRGHIVTEEDIPVLLSMGKERLYVWEDVEGVLHEDEAAERLAALCRGAGICQSAAREGKIELFAERDGLFRVDTARLNAVNDLDDMMIATRRGDTAVKRGDKLAGTRIIPLTIPEERIQAAEELVGNAPLLSITPWKLKTCGVIATGSEVASGLIEDRFTPVIIHKLKDYGVEVTERCAPGDNAAAIAAAALEYDNKGLDMILCTGGMSVDPDDRTPGAIKATGAEIVCYGAPILPGAMFLLGYFPSGTVIAGLPGCVMHAKTTIFDVFLPRIIAGVRINRKDIKTLGHGGLCLGCGDCRYPVCGFGTGS